jgi:aminoglycoside phosphotransferase (APT) family kinase protein
MLISKLHDAEPDVSIHQVALMVADQFPAWAGLPLTPVPSTGTDNVMLRLGDRLVVRLPRIASAVPLLTKELQHARHLRPQLPAAIPVPLAEGTPARGYPWPWTVSGWLEGKHPSVGHLPGPRLATDLAAFIRALHAVDCVSEATRGPLRSHRGGPLADRDVPTRSAIAQCEGLLDRSLLTAAWETASRVAEGDGKQVWIHTDLQPGNILTVDGRLSGVLDWGGVSVGDPAVDLIVAWNLLDDTARVAFRDALDVDEPTWARGRAWALSIGIIAYPYYVDTNPALARVSRYQIEQVVSDVARRS